MKNLFYIKDKKGFTLIEMLIVILIIVILLAIAVPSVIAYREDSQTTADAGGAKTVYTALEAALANHVIEVPTTLPSAAWEARDSDGDGADDEIVYRSTVDPSKAHNELPGANDFLNPEVFSGYYRYGYSTETNSINWVSYHPGDEAIVANSEVMVYDVLNDRTGYLDDLIRTYGTTESKGYHENAYGHLLSAGNKHNFAFQ